MNHEPRSTYNTSPPMNEMLFVNERLSPSIAVPINVTVTIPMTMPSVVRIERSLFARMALQEIDRPSRSSVRKFIQAKADNWICGWMDWWMATYRASRSFDVWLRATQSGAGVYFPLRNAIYRIHRNPWQTRLRPPRNRLRE